MYLFLFQDAAGGISLIWTLLWPLLVLGVLTTVAIFLYRYKTGPDSSELSLSSSSERVLTVARRYRDGYLVARTINGLGGIIKITGLIVGGASLFIGFLLANSQLGSVIIVGAAIGFLVGFVFYVWGVLVSARVGKRLKPHSILS